MSLMVLSMVFSCGDSSEDAGDQKDAGEQKTDDYCGCAKEAMQMTKEAGSDADKVKAAAAKAGECVKMLEGKSPEELAEIGKDCTDLMSN